jgi:hypothetical protein
MEVVEVGGDLSDETDAEEDCIVLDIYSQHLDRDQVDAPELCSNWLWAP